VAELNRAHTSERAARHSTHRRKDDEPLLRKVRTADGVVGLPLLRRFPSALGCPRQRPNGEAVSSR
jgi:hypothetical protein